MIHFLRSQISSVSRELELKRTQLLWESTKLTETEAKLYKTEQDKSKIANTLCKLRLQLQESKDKENEGQRFLCIYPWKCICSSLKLIRSRVLKQTMLGL